MGGGNWIDGDMVGGPAERWGNVNDLVYDE